MSELEDMSFQIEDFSLNFNMDETENRWVELIKQIKGGNVIPVIGPDLLICNEDGRNYHQFIIDTIAKFASVKSHPRTFSQLLYDSDFQSMLGKNKKDNGFIYNLIDQMKNCKVSPHPLLKRLLVTKQFPFVITTSFMPVVEHCMRDIYGDVEVRIFNNDPQTSAKFGIGDIKNEDELKKPTVFYMFGRVCKDPHRYVVTDMDMMEFCQSWMAGGDKTPRNISECIRKRYLLFLGGSYSDWLFRFIWFSMRHPSGEKNNSSMFVVSNNNNTDDDTFENFLERLGTFTQDNPEYVIEQIETRLAKCEKKQDKTKPDVFLSYSRSDDKITTHLYEELKSRGLNVWFDKNALGAACDWEKEIVTGIHQSLLFVPILTKNIESESLESHEYRMEWDEASKIAKRLGGRTFIIPVAENGFDFYNPTTKLPDVFKGLNATFYSKIEDVPMIADTIVAKLQELKELINKMKK